MAKNKIYLGVDGVWKYYCAHQSELEKAMKLIAVNNDYDIEIHITDEDGILEAVVYLESMEVDREQIPDLPSCRETIKDMFQTYIYGAASFIEARKKQLEEDENDELMLDRETQLDDAVYDMLAVFIGDALDVHSKETESMFETFKDLICESLYRDHAIEVYRPMYIADDYGNEEFVLYPYSEILDTEES